MSASAKKVYLESCKFWQCRPNKQILALLEPKISEQVDKVNIIDVSGFYIGEIGFYPLFDTIKKMKDIQQVDLSNTRLANKELEYLLRGIQSHPSIHTLLLQNNCLDDDVVESILDYLDECKGIQLLELSGNRFSSSVIQDIEGTLAQGAKRGEEMEDTIFNISEIRNGTILPPTDAPVDLAPANSSGKSTLCDEYVQRVRALYTPPDKKLRDHDFPPALCSLAMDVDSANTSYPASTSWQRLTEVTGDGSFECDPCSFQAASSNSVEKEYKWFLATVQALTAKPSLITSPFMYYDPEAGCATFRFFKNQRWEEVIVDDLFFVDNSKKVWPSGHDFDKSNAYLLLLEKAYAKLHQFCYECIGETACSTIHHCKSVLDLYIDCLQDLTGGLSIKFNIPEDIPRVAFKDALLTRLTKYNTEENRLITFFNLDRKVYFANGLPDNAFYTLKKTHEINGDTVLELTFFTDVPTSFLWEGKCKVRSKAMNSVNDKDDHEKTKEETSESPRCESGANTLFFTLDEVVRGFSAMVDTVVYPSFFCYEGFFERNTPYSVPIIIQTARDKMKMDTAETEENIWIGLHQSDERIPVLNTTNIEQMSASGNDMGFNLVLVDNDNELLVETIDELMKLETIARVIPSKKRDHFARIAPKDLSPNKVLALIPLGSVHHASSFVVSVSGGIHLKGEVRPVPQQSTAKITGRWSAGYPPENSRWRDNAQYIVNVSETSEFSVCLTVTSDCDIPKIGFSIHNASGMRKMLFFDKNTVLKQIDPSAERTVQIRVTLQGTLERLGKPYFIVPFCVDLPERVKEIEYQLEITGNRNLSLSEINSRFDWNTKTFEVPIRDSLKNNGGGLSYPTWRFSPQFFLQFPVEREGNVLVSVYNSSTTASNTSRNSDIFVSIIRLDKSSSILRGRRQLSFPTTNVVKTASGKDTVEALFQLDGSENQPRYLLLVGTEEPYKEVDLSVSIYSGPQLKVTCPREWECLETVTGEWQLGKTAGGCRADHPSWINNPFFNLELGAVRKYQLVIVLVFFPESYITRRLRRCGMQKVSLPTATKYPYLNTSLHVDLVRFDEKLSEVCSACSELGQSDLTFPLLLMEDQIDDPYILVPSTAKPQCPGHFKLFVYSNEPIKLSNIQKDRLPYV